MTPAANALAVPLALGRKEGFRLLRSPLPWIGVALTTVLVGLREGEALVLPDAVPWRGLAMFPMAGLVLVESTVATLRSRRHHTEELFSSLPATITQRTGAHLLATLFTGAVAVMVIAAWLALALAGGAVGRVDVPDLLTGPVLVVGGGVAGVAVARLLPLSWAASLLVIAIGFIEAGLASIEPPSNPLHRLAPWMPDDQIPTFLTDRPSGWHLVYLAGIIGAVVSIALLRTAHSRGVKAALAVSLVVAVVAGIVQTRPMTDGRAAEIADLVARPDRHQSCETHDHVQLCAYPEYAGQIDWWAPPAVAVTERVDEHLAGRRLTVRQSVTGFEVSQLPRKVRRLLPPDVPRSIGSHGWSDGAVHPSFSWPYGDSGDLYMALAVAGWTVGLPPSPPHDRPCSPAGQAQGVVALWLAATATPGARATFVRGVDVGIDGWAFDEGYVTIEPASYVATFPAAVQFGEADVRIVRRLVERRDSDVWAVLDRSWDHFANASTPSAELAAAFGLEAVDAPTRPRPPCP